MRRGPRRLRLRLGAGAVGCPAAAPAAAGLRPRVLRGTPARGEVEVGGWRGMLGGADGERVGGGCGGWGVGGGCGGAVRAGRGGASELLELPAMGFCVWCFFAIWL